MAIPSGAQEAPPHLDGILVRSVPAGTTVFVNVNRLADLERAIKQAHAGQFLTILSGQGTATSVPDLKEVIRTLTGLGSNVSNEDLLRCEVGFVAEKFSDIAHPVWLMAAADEDMVARWFPQHSPAGKTSDAARIFRTDDGRFVCIRGRVVAIAPRTSDWTKLGSILRSMAGGDADVLASTTAYRQSIAYLPTRSLATVFVSGLGAESTPDHLAVGLYSKGETIDLAFRGTKSHPVGQGGLSPTAMERMLKLPASTLGAYISTVNWSAPSSTTDSAQPGVLARYTRLFRDLSVADPADQTPPVLGNHVIFAWGQDLSGSGSAPQFAMLLEAKDSREVMLAARRVAVSLVRIASTLELRDLTEDLPVSESSHLGVRIQSIPLREFAEKSRFGWMKLLANLEPAWAVSGDWFLLSLSPDHLHQILDAQIGFLPILGNERGVRSLREAPQNHTAAAYLQGSLAATTMQAWVGALRKGGADVSLKKLWQQGTGTEQMRLGIELADEDDFGQVEVARVTPASPADGRLQPGDRIIGVDGRLLELVSPADDLQEWWDGAEPGSSHTLRVIRDGEVMELEVRRPHDQASLADVFQQPVDMLRELAAVFEAIPSATFQVHNTGADDFSALLKLRLSRAESP